jgi:hypothetical protein
MKRIIDWLLCIDRDLSGNDIRLKLNELDDKYGGDWSYLKDERVYEDTITGRRMKCYEV